MNPSATQLAVRLANDKITTLGSGNDQPGRDFVQAFVAQLNPAPGHGFFTSVREMTAYVAQMAPAQVAAFQAVLTEAYDTRFPQGALPAPHREELVLTMAEASQPVHTPDLVINERLRQPFPKMAYPILGFAPGQVLGSFMASVRRPKSSRQGLITQFFGENGKDSDTQVLAAPHDSLRGPEGHGTTQASKRAYLSLGQALAATQDPLHGPEGHGDTAAFKEAAKKLADRMAVNFVDEQAQTGNSRIRPR